MLELTQQWLEKVPAIQGYETLISSSLTMALICLIAVFAFYIFKYGLIRLITTFITKTSSNLDDVLIKQKLFSRIAYLLPAYLLYTLSPQALAHYPIANSVIETGLAVIMVVLLALIVMAIINSLLEIYHSFAVSRQIPIQGFAQVAKIITCLLAIITIAALILGESPFKLFAGLGAMTAVLMLVFKDPILGFVAGLQLSSNRMVGIGDWVDIPQHNASGDILEIGLTTVKVQNFDNTITTVPTQSLINDSFKNWRGMQESQGRRIKRSIFVDVNSIEFCTEESLNRYSKIDYIKEYIQAKHDEVTQYNQQSGTFEESRANGRRLTNIGTFRAYVLAYLEHHPQINQDLTILARQLAPTESGLPIEIYAFSTDKDWANYEAIQADIFDHLFAVVNEFDLNVFQKPSGIDFRQLGVSRNQLSH